METRARSIAKMLTYRAITTTLLAALTWIFTGSIEKTTLITVIFNLAASLVYYFHERIWLNVKWGLRKKEPIS
jgi:uncharacterized membrane protein